VEEFVTFVLEKGVTQAVVIVALGFAVYKLYNRNQELHTTLYDIGRESIKSNEAAAASINRLTDVLRMRGNVSE
jgi:hypothetical protein